MLMLTLGAAALAHMALEEPLPRYPSDGSASNKACPCGIGQSNRLCDAPSDRSDPDRSTDVTTYGPGETITLRWRETIGHAGRWRVAFDPDGADMGDFNDTILLDITDPGGSAGNMGGNLWEVEVTLPTTPCDNCTLQLVQMMDGNTADPVPDPIGRSSYYQCADIVIEEESGDTDTDTDVDTDSPDTDPPVDTDTDSDSDTGNPIDAGTNCGCQSATPGGMTVLALLGLLAGFRRRS